MPGGPRSAAGKAVAKMNGTMHGLRALTPVLPTERVEEWEEHRVGILDALTPVGALEQALAERIVLVLWRLQRVAHFEIAVAGAAQEEIEREYINEHEEQGRYEFRGPYHSYAPSDLRAELRAFPARARLLRRLDTRASEQRVAGVDAGDILHQCGRMAQYTNDDFDPETVDYPLPDDCDWDEFPAITVGMLRACIVAIARAANAERADLIAGTIYHYECEERAAQMRLDEAERTIAQRRERSALLPMEHLDKVLRYEGHLHRQLLQTLHELEALQARRAGQPAPLARLDVQGLEATG